MDDDDDGPSPPSEALTKALEGSRRWTVEERSRYCDELVDTPLFQPRMSEAEAAVSGIAQAVRNAEYDEIDTPFALANEAKGKGNEAFARGAEWFPNAIRHYNEAIGHATKAGEAEVDPDHPQPHAARPTAKRRREARRLLSVCHANLAAIYLARGKYITAVDSSDRALRLWPDNSKAAFRAAKACLALGRAAACLDYCEAGSLADADNAGAFDALVKEAREAVARQDRMAAQSAKEAAEREASLARVRAACTERGLRVGPPVFNSMKRTRAEPYVDAEGGLHWPVLLLYPETSQSDYLEDVPESATIADVLAHMMMPPPWDAGGAHVPANIDVFFRTHVCKPIPMQQAWTSVAEEAGPEEAWRTSRMVRVPHDCPLLAPLLQAEYVIADIPVFYIVARKTSQSQLSPFYADLKAKAGGDFVTLRVPDFLTGGDGDGGGGGK
jgi:tetratricopeptide (TPR) repeat protein